MNPAVRRTLAVLLALGVTLGIAALSRVPYTAGDPDGALIRLSWRTPGAVVEECRRLSQEELERLPVHMRREEVCERRMLPYRLQVRIDDRLVHEERVRPAGARGDRPLYVFHELPVAPGSYRVEVLWEPEGDVALESAASGPGASEGVTERSTPAGAAPPQRPGATPPRHDLGVQLRLEPGDVSLITYDVDRQVLTARGRGLVHEGTGGSPLR